MPSDHPYAPWHGPVHQPDNAHYGPDGDRLGWASIPPGDEITPAQNTAEAWNICQRATDKVNGYCNQVLAATLDTELIHGPDFRLTVGPGGGGALLDSSGMLTGNNARAIMSRWPILQVAQVTFCPNGVWPRQFQTVPTGMFEPEVPPIGIFGSIAPASSAFGGQAVLIAPGFIDWRYGRNGYAAQITYVNGWPHAEITQNATAGSTSLSVSDVTGWAITSYQGQLGATGIIKDSGQQETAHCTAATSNATVATVLVGPGTLQLSSPTVYPHPAGTILTTLPATIEQACILFATAEALTRGATTTTIHDIGGHAQNTGGDVAGLNSEAELLCHPFRRVI